MELRAQTEKEFLNALTRFRKELDLTQEDLSEKSGIPQSSISKFELGSRTPSLILIFRILKAMNLEITIRSKAKNISKDDGVII